MRSKIRSVVIAIAVAGCVSLAGCSTAIAVEAPPPEAGKAPPPAPTLTEEDKALLKTLLLHVSASPTMGRHRSPCSSPSSTSPPTPVKPKYTWDFGDGSKKSHEQNPKHTYKKPGKYKAIIKVTTRSGRPVKTTCRSTSSSLRSSRSWPRDAARAIVLAAGLGTRMTPPCRRWCTRSAAPVDRLPAECLAPHRRRSDRGRRRLRGGTCPRCVRAIRGAVRRPAGTEGDGHAARAAREALGEFSGDLLLVYGDLPFLRAETFERLVAAHRAAGARCRCSRSPLATRAGLDASVATLRVTSSGSSRIAIVAMPNGRSTRSTWACTACRPASSSRTGSVTAHQCPARALPD